MSSAKGEKRFKVVKKNKESPLLATSAQGHFPAGGSSQSIYATNLVSRSDHAPGQEATQTSSALQDRALEPDRDGWFGGPASSASSTTKRIPKDRNDLHSDDLSAASDPSRQLRKSRSGLSLSERLGMDDIKEASSAEPMPNLGMDDASRRKEKSTTRPSDSQQKGNSKNGQTPLIDRLGTPTAQTPLSASDSPPETPLKHIGRGDKKRADLLATPGSEQAVHDARLGQAGSSRTGGLLLQSEGDSPVFPKELQTPKRDALGLGLMSSPSRYTNGSQSQIDTMLAKLKLVRTEASSQAGTQQSRWAVPEPKPVPMALDGSILKSESHAEKGEVEVKELPSIPTAPRALREKSELRDSSPPAKSLLERMAIPASEESPAPVKGKKDRTRGGKKGDVKHESTPAKPKEKEAVNTSHSTKVREPADVSHHPAAPLAAPDHADNDQPKSKSPPAEETSTPTLASSTSAASVMTDHTTDGSAVGNDTWGTINWADDDDDLPELPEEWMRAASEMKPEEANGDVPSPAALQEAVKENRTGNNDLNGDAQRGARRGGRGRGAKRDRQVTPTAQSSRGIKIAGSAAQAPKEPKRAPKELFPMHKQDSAPRLNTAPPPREQRAHGRPKLMSSNKETFSRLTKGALGVPAATGPSAPSPQAPLRK